MTTEEELRQLAADGFSSNDRIKVGHFFHHTGASPDERRTFREALKAAGFGAGDGKVDTGYELGDPYWFHYSYTHIPASRAECKRLDSLARQIAGEHGVHYDGWKVARDREGRLRT